MSLENTDYIDILRSEGEIDVLEFNDQDSIAPCEFIQSCYIKKTNGNGSIELSYPSANLVEISISQHGLSFDEAVSCGDLIIVNNASSLYNASSGKAKCRIFEKELSIHKPNSVVFDDESNAFYVAIGLSKNYTDFTTASQFIDYVPGEFARLDSFPDI